MRKVSEPFEDDMADSAHAEKTTAIVHEITKAISGHVTVEKILPARCGITAKIDVKGRAALLKYVDADEHNRFAAHRVNGIHNEVDILTLLGRDVVASPREQADTAWLVQPWIDGNNAWHHTAFVRQHPVGTDDRTRFLTEATRISAALENLHRHGVLHGDLQPRHVIVGDDESTHLIDFDVSVRTDNDSPQYVGGLVHHVAPEVATGMLRNDKPIPINPRTEVFALGSVLFQLYTGTVPHWYGTDPTVDDFATTDRDRKCRAVVEGRRRTFAHIGAPPFDDFADILNTCLAYRPADRFGTVADVTAALHAIGITAR